MAIAVVGCVPILRGSSAVAQTAPISASQLLPARVAFLTACGFDDWIRPVDELRQADIDRLNELLPLNRFAAIDPADRQPRADLPPAGCDELKPKQPPAPETSTVVPAAPAGRRVTPCTEPTCFVKHERPVLVPGNRLRVAVIGDMGVLSENDEDEKTDAELKPNVVARRIREVCAAAADLPSCSFSLLLGDNLYPDGISNADDEVAFAKLINRYGMPAYVALGNHDWDPLWASQSRARRTLSFISKQVNAFGNSHFYDFEGGPARFWAIDSNFLVRAKRALRRIEDEEAWLEQIKESAAEWKIVFGHHPYLSNGDHGNAGEFRDFLFNWRGKDFKKFIERHVLEHADVLLSGHDHNLQFYPSARKGKNEAALVVSGAAAKCKGEGRRHNRGQGNTVAPTFEYYGHGFTLLDITAQRLTVEMHRYDNGTWSTWRAWKDAGAEGKWSSDKAYGPVSSSCVKR